MDDSYGDSNTCAKTLLAIVARGNAIITELLRLVDLVPAPFRRCDNKNNYGQHLDESQRLTLDNLICDFSYFKNSDTYDAFIEANETLKKADEDLCYNYTEILTRFYLTFESVQRYATDLNQFIVDLEDESFVGQSLDALLIDTDGRQLLCEAYFLLGYMLLVTDNQFEGSLRERLIVSYCRYSSQRSSPDSILDETCNLMRSTGFRTLGQQVYRSTEVVVYNRPKDYPESFFGRVKVNQSIVNLLIAKLQTDDIYSQSVTTFPHPDHRSIALCRQASILYVLLYFCPQILKTQRSRMREITDKFFYDNWVISLYMGDLVNLIEAWNPYKAANESVVQLLETESVRNLSSQFYAKLTSVSKAIAGYLEEGWLGEDSVLEHHMKILNNIREGNVVFKWMLLHSQMYKTWRLKLTRSLYSTILENQPDRAILYGFLQNLSNLERRFDSVHEMLLSKRDRRIMDNRIKVSEMLDELIEIFSDLKPNRFVSATGNTNLVNLLSTAKYNLDAIDYDSISARESVIKLINSIETARDSYSDGKSLQVVQLFMDVKDGLLKILRYLNLDERMSTIRQSAGDFSYAWQIMDANFTCHIQQVIKLDPIKTYGIESTFLKLSSSCNTHLSRIKQSNSEADLNSVNQYYSKKLVAYMRDVLHIIPATILELVSQVIAIQTDNVMGKMPSKIPLDNIKEYALPEKRFQMLELTFKISHYAEGLMLMRNTSIGPVKINSKQLLEDGIRRELVQRMSDSIQQILYFSEPDDQDGRKNSNTTQQQVAENLLARLKRLASVMDGYKRSFEYIQDYLFIYGLRMWQEELNRVVKFNVEQATWALMNENYLQLNYNSPGINQQLSVYQSAKCPIPIYSMDALQSSFIARILEQLLIVTDPKATIYDEQLSTWYEQKSPHDQVVDIKVFELISAGLSIGGLNGFDEVCGTLIMIEIQKLDGYLLTTAANEQLLEAVEAIRSIQKLSAEGTHNKQAARVFSNVVAKIAPYSERVVNNLLRIGQLQAIRNDIAFVLSTKCRYEARNLYNCLETLNSTLISTLKLPKKKLSQRNTINDTHDDDYGDDIGAQAADELEISSESNLEESQLIFELANHLQWIGLSDPMSKIYTLALQTSSSQQVNEFREQLVPIYMIFLILLEQCSKFHFSRSINGFVPKQTRSFYESSQPTIDGQPFFYGIMTLVNHYQPLLPLETADSCIQNGALHKLLQLLGLFVKCSLVDCGTADNTIRPQDLNLRVANVILSVVELLRLARQRADDLLLDTYLPKYITDTFQFTICHLNK